MSSILSPCTLSFFLSHNPDQQTRRIQCNMSDLCLNVTPRSIQIIYKSVMAFMQSGQNDFSENDKSEAENDFNELWIPKSYQDREFWFLKDDTSDEVNAAKEALETLSSTTTTSKMDEQAVFMINNLVVKIESGIGNIPLLLMESSISMNVKDWSSKRMTMIGSLNLELAYYNAKLALWEPVIEPLAKTTDQIKSR